MIDLCYLDETIFAFFTSQKVSGIDVTATISDQMAGIIAMGKKIRTVAATILRNGGMQISLRRWRVMADGSSSSVSLETTVLSIGDVDEDLVVSRSSFLFVFMDRSVAAWACTWFHCLESTHTNTRRKRFWGRPTLVRIIVFWV